MIFAVYWLLGSCVIGTIGALVMEAFGQPSPGHTATVFAQMGFILGWLAFVVYRGTKGGTFRLDGDTLRYRRFLVATTRQLLPNPASAAFVTHSEGTTYVNGPALVFETDRGELSIATMDAALGERLGVLPADTQLVGPTLILDPSDFERLAARMR